jgi:hypothetical protein
MKESDQAEDSHDPLKLPEEVETRLRAWQSLYMRGNTFYYIFGGLGVATSGLAAAFPSETSRYLSVVSAGCIALLGFTQPEKKYIKFVRAWRILDIAAMRYRYKLISIDALFEALERGEQSITEFEQEISSVGTQVITGAVKPQTICKPVTEN